jgi:streptogramin lyase/predicted Ser/Thr protein kinase
VPVRDELGVGDELLGYRIERVLGRGGMGIVFLAHQQVLDRLVALKLLLPEYAEDAAFRGRFLRESRLAASLEHPAIVPLYDAGEVDGRLYLAMRYVEGGDLGAMLAREAPLEPARAMALLSQVASALDTAHANGLVHRDVKPGNILVEDEHAYLADFGLAKSVAEPGRVDASHHIASVSYVAPEQIERGPVTAATDVYSLGCVLYECLCGSPPFQEDTVAAALFGHLEAPVPQISQRNPSLPGEIDDVLQTALAKEPAERQPSCMELIADAEQALGLATTRSRLRRHAAWLAAAAVLVVAAAGFGLLQLIRDDGAAVNRTPAADSVARLDPSSGEIQAVIKTGTDPSTVAIGGESVWVLNSQDGTVAKIDPETGALERTIRVRGLIPLDVGPTIAADGDGAWLVTSEEGQGFLEELGDLSGVYPREIPLGELDPLGVAVGEGFVWVLGKSVRGNALLKIDGNRRAVVDRLAVSPGEQVQDIAAGGGSVWFTDWGTEETLSRVDPETMRITGRVDTAGDDSIAIGEGAVWLGDIETGIVSRVDPETMRVQKRVKAFEPPFLAAVDLAAGGGAVWLSNTDTGQVYRIDPDTLRIDARTDLAPPEAAGNFPPGPRGIAAGDDGVWVAIGDK